MSTFSIDGLISGLDTSKLIEGMLSLEQAPITRLQNRRNQATERITAFQNLNARLLSFRVSAQRLAQTSTFQGRNVSSSDTNLVNATVNSSALAGAHVIKVNKLAAAHQISSDSKTTNNTDLGLSGDILVGGKGIRIEATDDLTEIATKINNAGAGVRASVVRVDANDFRLSIRRIDTGSTTIQLADASGSSVLASLGVVSGVESLKTATANEVKSDGFTSKTAAIGTLLGLTSAPTGTVSFDNASPFSVNINLATDSLESIVDKFNAAKGSSALSISIVEETVNNKTVQRLQIENGSGIALADFTDDNNVLETLGILAPTIKNEDQAAANADVVVDGIQLFRSTNTINDVLTGVTLYLTGEDVNKNVSLSITQSDSSALDAIQKFVTDYNGVIDFIKQNASYNPDTKTGGLLLGDSTVLGTQSSLFSLVGSSVPKLPTTQLAELNGGNGVRAGSIRITNRAGTAETINLSSAATVQDVINAINNQTNLKVRATVNASGTGLILTDTSGGFGGLKIEEDGGFTAADLGLAGESFSNVFNGSSIGAGGKMNLSSIGISATSTGTLTLNIGTLQQKLTSDPEGVMNLFTTATSGIANKAAQQLDTLTNANKGAIKTKTDGLQATIKRMDSDITRYEARVTRMEARLRTQFATLETTLARMQSQGQFITAQLSQLTNLNARR